MGNELACTLHHQGKSYSGKALLEYEELLFRGETRLRIKFSAVKDARCNDGSIEIHTKEGVTVFDLGPQAAKWREKILHPKSLLEKLGVKSGDAVTLFGEFPAEFQRDLKRRKTRIVKDKISTDTGWVFFVAERTEDLRAVPKIRKAITGRTALWRVYPKGQKSVTERDVRCTGLRAGLVDVKVVSLSATHTGLKFVVPKAKR